MFSDAIDGNVVAIGDTHGDRRQTEQLLAQLRDHGHLEDRWVVFLGDYVDVGPDSAGVIQLLLDFRAEHPQTTFLAGNHDLNLAKAIDLVPSPHGGYYRSRTTARNLRTLKSYGATDATDLLVKMPAEHKAFLSELPWCVRHPDFLFVHCGFDPNEPLDVQLRTLVERDTNLFKPKWLHDNRLAFRDHAHQTDKLVVAGHTIVRDVTRIGNKLLLDTGAGYGGALSGVLLPELEVVRADAPDEAESEDCTRLGNGE